MAIILDGIGLSASGLDGTCSNYKPSDLPKCESMTSITKTEESDATTNNLNANTEKRLQCWVMKHGLHINNTWKEATLGDAPCSLNKQTAFHKTAINFKQVISHKHTIPVEMQYSGERNSRRCCCIG